MNILPHKLRLSKEAITSQSSLLAPLQLMQSLDFARCIDQNFQAPKRKSGFPASTYLQSIILLLHSGGTRLDDMRTLRNDAALVSLLDIPCFPSSRAVGAWLHRMSKEQGVIKAQQAVNQHLLQVTLGNCKSLTLDIDATEVIAHKSTALWTYKGNKGYMPMLGHIAETGQVVAYDFRQGNVPPSKNNLAFIQHCVQSLPKGFAFKALRADAASYQQSIIQHCDQHNMQYAIRAKMSKYIRDIIKQIADADWQPILDNSGKATGQSTYRTVHCIRDYAKPFCLIIQRQAKTGQLEIDLEDANNEIGASDEYQNQQYIYRCIATNIDAKTDLEIIDWYNQRGECSENRIKELKCDFGAEDLPCSDHQANSLYFFMCILAYNLFVLMRALAPTILRNYRAKRVRWLVYRIAGKVVRGGRQLRLNITAMGYEILEQLVAIFQAVIPPPKIIEPTE